MKELEHYSKINEDIQVVKPIKKELKLLGSLKPQKGHKCFEINLNTNEISEATYVESEIVVLTSNADYKINRKVNVKQDCIYITALNKENAIKKLNKLK